MPGYLSHIKYVFIITGVILSMCSCSVRRQTAQQHIKTVTLNSDRTIDNYQYRGVKMFVYDTTVIVIRERGDTVRTDHRSNTIIDTETEQIRDTVYINTSDSIQTITNTVVRNELSKTQRLIYNAGLLFIGCIIAAVIFIIIKVFINRKQ